MAIYHLTAKVISREKGRSAVAAAAFGIEKQIVESLDLAVVPCNSLWPMAEKTGHACVSENLQFLRSLRQPPRLTIALHYGTDDPVVPFDMSETLAKDFGARATFVPVPDVRHVPHQIDLSPIVANWLARNHLDGAR